MGKIGGSNMGHPVVYSLTATATPQECTMGAAPRSILFQNLSEENSLYISFDGGTVYMQIFYMSSVELPGGFQKFYYKADTGKTAAFKVIATM